MSVRSVIRCCAASAVLVIGVLCLRPVWAIDSETELEKRDNKDMRALRTQLFKGELSARPDDKDHVDALDIKARYVTHPFTWARYQESLNPTPGSVHKIFDEFDSDLGQLARYRDRTGVATRLYCRKVIEHAGEVIAASPTKPIASINAARILARIVERTSSQTPETWPLETLPRLAEGNADVLASLWLTLVTGKTNDAVKYLAWRGLRDLLALPPQTPPLVKKETEQAIYHEAIKGIDHKMVYPAGTPKEEVFGYQFLRREMIRVLALNRQPVLDKDRPALTLLRIAASDIGVSPQPRLDERVEAAIGLARLRAGKGSDYQPDYAVAGIALAVYDFGVEHNKEADREAGEKLSTAARAARRTRPWKVEAGQIAEALEALRQDVKSPYVANAAKECLDQLAMIESGKNPKPGDLGDWMRTNECPAKELFKGDVNTAVKPAVAEKGE
jgi:hypothetical protein